MHGAEITLQLCPSRDAHPHGASGGCAGDRELAQELAYKCKEHDQLATEARGRANAVAFDGFNRSLLNRWKARCSRRPCANGLDRSFPSSKMWACCNDHKKPLDVALQPLINQSAPTDM
jgi:hypothetical protein